MQYSVESKPHRVPVANNPRSNEIVRGYLSKPQNEARCSFLAAMSDIIALPDSPQPELKNQAPLKELLARMMSLRERFIEINRQADWRKLQYAEPVPTVVTSEEPVALRDINLNIRREGQIFMIRQFFDVMLFADFESMLRHLPSDPPRPAGTIPPLSDVDKAALAFRSSFVTVEGQQLYRGNMPPDAPFFTMFLNLSKDGALNWRFHASGYSRILNFSISEMETSSASFCRHAPSGIRKKIGVASEGNSTRRLNEAPEHIEYWSDERRMNQSEADFLSTEGIKLVEWAEPIIRAVEAAAT